MRKLSFFLVALLIAQEIAAQILEPAKWSYDVSKKEVEIGEEIELIFKAVIDPDWYLYSSDFDPDLGPMLTEFEFEEHESYELLEAINRAYADSPSLEEQAYRQRIRQKHRKLVEGQW